MRNQRSGHEAAAFRNFRAVGIRASDA